MKPLVSVIVPVYNGAPFIKAALESARTAMGEIACEIIVVNDGSTDGTELALEPWMGQIKYVVQPNQGAAAARNAGLSRAMGTYVAFLDADDIWLPNHIQVLLAEFNKKPETEIVMGRLQRFWSSVAAPESRIFYGQWTLQPSFGSALIKWEVFQKVGLVHEAYRLHEDVDWFLRVVEARLKIVTVRDVVSYYRVHEQNTTHDLRPGDMGLLRVLAASLKRRGAKELPSLREVGV